jgi:hypothetical protein
MCGQHHAPAALPPGKDPVPVVQEAGWAPEPVWIGAENLAPPGFDPRTFHLVESRYIDYAIPAPFTHSIFTLLLTDACDSNVLYDKPDDPYP